MAMVAKAPAGAVGRGGITIFGGGGGGAATTTGGGGGAVAPHAASVAERAAASATLIFDGIPRPMIFQPFLFPTLPKLVSVSLTQTELRGLIAGRVYCPKGKENARDAFRASGIGEQSRFCD